MDFDIKELKSLLEELEELEEQAESMHCAWNSDDECARAENDPGLQYELHNEIDAKIEEIKCLCLKIGTKK